MFGVLPLVAFPAPAIGRGSATDPSALPCPHRGLSCYWRPWAWATVGELSPVVGSANKGGDGPAPIAGDCADQAWGPKDTDQQRTAKTHLRLASKSVCQSGDSNNSTFRPGFQQPPGGPRQCWLCRPRRVFPTNDGLMDTPAVGDVKVFPLPIDQSGRGTQ